jgi:arsenate reductase
MRYSFTMKAKIYHNPRCSKSRSTLALLEARGIDLEIVEYLKNPPTAAEIRRLLGKLGLKAADIVRRGEAAFKASGLDAEAGEDELIALLVREPSVIERPIVELGNAACVGRPPERVLELVD